MHHSRGDLIGNRRQSIGIETFSNQFQQSTRTDLLNLKRKASSKVSLCSTIFTIRCDGCESGEWIRADDQASDRLEVVLDVDVVYFLGPFIVRRILSTLFIFNGKCWNDRANWVMSGAESSVGKFVWIIRVMGEWCVGKLMVCAWEWLGKRCGLIGSCVRCGEELDKQLAEIEIGRPFDGWFRDRRRLMFNADSELDEAGRFGLDDERWRLLVIELERSSNERRRAGMTVEGCSDKPIGRSVRSRKYKFDQMVKSRTDDDG